MVAPRLNVFVGLGEGIGNVLMGLPLIDALHEAGHTVFLDLRPTPEWIKCELGDLIGEGRAPWLRAPFTTAAGFQPYQYDAACLTHWWLARGGPLPKARETFLGGAPSEVPEILANLDAARLLAPDAAKRAILLPGHLPDSLDTPLTVAIHPGCKPDPEWRARKVYPRWPEVTHRLKDLGARVLVVGTPADLDIYCGEPHQELRDVDLMLRGTADALCNVHALVSGDSGIHHMAVALGMPTVALFGQSSVEKARHPDPAIPPLVFGPGFDGIDPRDVAKAAVEASRSYAAL